MLFIFFCHFAAIERVLTFKEGINETKMWKISGLSGFFHVSETDKQPSETT